MPKKLNKKNMHRKQHGSTSPPWRSIPLPIPYRPSIRCTEYPFLRNGEGRALDAVAENDPIYATDGRALFTRQEAVRGSRRFCLFEGGLEDALREIAATPVGQRFWYARVEEGSRWPSSRMWTWS